MFVADLLIAFVVTVIMMVFLMFVFRMEGPTSRRLLVALAIFLAAWVGGLWLVPFGPTVRGAYWAPFLAVGVVFGLIWLAIAPWPRREGIRSPRPPRDTGPAPEEPEEVVAVSGFFWLVIVVFAVLIAVGYLRG